MDEAASCASLTALAPGVYAWCGHPPDLGRANAGVVVDEDGLTFLPDHVPPSMLRAIGAT